MQITISTNMVDKITLNLKRRYKSLFKSMHIGVAFKKALGVDKHRAHKARTKSIADYFVKLYFSAVL